VRGRGTDRWEGGQVKLTEQVNSFSRSRPRFSVSIAREVSAREQDPDTTREGLPFEVGLRASSCCLGREEKNTMPDLQG
jgi:hypothetical protein